MSWLAQPQHSFVVVATTRTKTGRCLGRAGVEPGGDRGAHGGVGDAVRRQVCQFEEHLLQAAGDHEGEEPAAFGAGGDLVPGPAGHEDVRSWACLDLLLADGERELAVKDAFMTW